MAAIDKNKLVDDEIDRARSFGRDGDIDLAVHSFALAREMIVRVVDQKVLKSAIEAEKNGFRRERDTYRKMIEGKAKQRNLKPALLSKKRLPEPNLVVFSDSLGLPRPNAKTGESQGADRTYPWLLADRIPDSKVASICQRFYTTRNVLSILSEDPSLGQNADVIIHVGLNDCANRMFQEDERIALSLYDEEVRKKIVGFAQHYRRAILQKLPSRHYVSREEFRSNLNEIVGELQRRGARQLVLATIILPPPSAWPGTPGVNFNFASYNYEIMATAQSRDIKLLDIDRHIWRSMGEGSLLEDGMHLSDEGHRIFAQESQKLIAE